MARFLTIVAGAVAVLALAVGAAPAAYASPVDDAVTALRSGPLYVAPGAVDKIDQGAVSAAIDGQPIKIAVLPPSAAADLSQLFAVAKSVGQRLGGRVTVGVVAGSRFNAASSALCADAASALAAEAVRAHLTQLQQTNDVTAMLEDFVNRVASAPRAGSAGCGGAATGSGDYVKQDSGGSAWPWVIAIAVIGLLGVGGGLLFVMSRRRRRQRLLAGRRAEIMSYYDRLGADVQNLDTKDNPVARQALADASERFTAAGSLLSQADSPGAYAAARRTVLEGLQGAQTARRALGLDPGPELPPIASVRGEQLSESRQIDVGGRTVQGYPQYTPGAPYYYGGGGGFLGGWYSFPFWEGLALGGVLGGGLGGWGGYGEGYEQGYDAGEDRGGDGGGGDWGGGGGGDWGGGGGGDWGGGGGGDWGGGGGGGGDGGGGSW